MTIGGFFPKETSDEIENEFKGYGVGLAAESKIDRSLQIPSTDTLTMSFFAQREIARRFWRRIEGFTAPHRPVYSLRR